MPNLIDYREDREANAGEQQAVFGGCRAALIGGEVCKPGSKRVHIRMSLSRVPLTPEAPLLSLVR